MGRALAKTRARKYQWAADMRRIAEKELDQGVD
jgi:hypothetical protein